MAPSAQLFAAACVLTGGACAYRGGAEYGTGSAPAPRLAATAWVVEEVGGRAVLDRKATALRFDAEGRVSGSTGCNNFTGNATIAAEKVTFSPLATTRRACEPEAMRQEQSFLRAMEAVRSFSLDPGGALRLLGADGDLLLRLSRAP